MKVIKDFKYDLAYKYVKSYIIGNDGNESVSCPYMRDCISETVLIDNYGNEYVLKCFSKKNFNNIIKINLKFC